jgi:GMP synthase (glutamine-hydrolysing)
MKIKEVTAKALKPKKFIDEKVKEISSTVGDGLAISALSGGVDSSTVTMLGHKALGKRLKTYFIENGLMRQNEPQEVATLFKELGVRVEMVDARKQFFEALRRIEDPEEKREAITQTFYKRVFGKLVEKSGAKFLLQGTILTDIDETIAGIKRQHNVFEQLGINPQKTFGYKIIEPLVELRKDGARKIAKALGLSKTVYDRNPFPGPALAARVIGEVTPKRIEIVKRATAIVEDELAHTNSFQSMAILHKDRITGVRAGKRKFGLQIEIRCWDSIDARIAKPTRLPFGTLERLARKITTKIPVVVSVVYNVTPKPPSTMEVV